MIPYLRPFGPIATYLHVTPCYSSFEMAIKLAQREYILGFIVGANGVKKNLPADRGECELFVLDTGRAMTGRRKLTLANIPTATYVDSSGFSSV
jgi:hypothetical protein